MSDRNPAAAVAIGLTDNLAQWTVSVFPANRTTSWLQVSALSGTGSAQLSLQASASGLSNGVYNATLIIQASSALPQFVDVPVVFVVGASSTTIIGAPANAGSYQSAFAPGMLLSVFGVELAPSIQAAGSLPLPLTMLGVSATVNGVSAPLYYVSPGQLNIQVPYETGSGTAVLGVNNNGQVASYLFQVAPAAPGIFTDASGALVPNASGKIGQELLLFITGEGDVSPQLADGNTPASGTPVSGLPKPRLPVSVTVGGVAATLQFDGIPSGVAGVTQINFTVPQVPTGPQQVVVTVGGVASAPATLTVTE